MRVACIAYILSAGLIVGALAIGCVGPVALGSAESAPHPGRVAAVEDQAPLGPDPPAARSPTTPVATVKLAYLPVVAHAIFFVAWEKGYWRELGLEVEGSEFGGSDQAMPFVANGQLDVAGGSSGAGFLNALAQGVGSRLVAGLAGVGPDGFSVPALMVRREDFESGRFTSPADLRGRRVAVNGKGGYLEFLADRHLRQGNLTIADVDMTILGLPDMLAGLVGGAVDAAELNEPTVTYAQDGGFAVSIARANSDPNGQAQVLLYGEQFVRGSPEGARRFMAGYLRALHDLTRSGYKSPSDVSIIARYTKLPAETVLRAVPPYVEPNGRMNLAHLETQQRFFAERGYLNYAEPLDLHRFVDTTWLDLAVQQLGAYEP
jgi:NitT/TauT family transport system substrate-binding protein